ncbi:transcription termination/antitermination protein NusA [Candidatus Beckwithbacteria bacterium CG23_combo_of_CG06-09_8_20_14_all_47_9]|uniref:Transcription termination/antitermination protein NusA n=1 Tax=Candidatus Beckwithbacteria bacterium CG23_combo_of_CG06-09_8_20_14_all_47_9 TaxID=1974498 RepID=A0A2H0B3B2_9BACT|nr:MAG: transcription termination/antitermination protein NusA [Candidatus Beckwithbacteria bacterium CG23_combo_of_CG06-09_8_20_14_all_47_9]
MPVDLTKMARTEFTAALNQICSERRITPESVIASIEEALVAAYRKDFGDDETLDFFAELNPVVGSAKIFKAPKDKPEAKKDITPPGFGRIAAQTAKQVILQKIREAEKDAIIGEYQDKIGSLVNGMVLRFDGQFIICDIGRGHALMPPEEQGKDERYHLNQRLTLYIKDIQETIKGKQIIISRADPALVKALFKREVPEVNSGAVEIKVIAREAGSRSKVVVASTQSGVDPVGSCVGQKGVRVQSVINELGGEKIDIIEYSTDPVKFISAALQPADNLEIKINEKTRTAEITVPEDQLSLAIGREGQNARLAAKLTGYKINLKGPKGTKHTAKKDDLEHEIDKLELSSRTRNSLVEVGITTVADLKKRTAAELTEIRGLGPKALEEITAKLG